MTGTRQFVACKFREGDKRTYTYHHDGEPLDIGDRVIVTTNRGPSTVIVAAISDDQPDFETKPIVGKERPIAEPKPTVAALQPPANCKFCCHVMADCDCLPF